MMSGDLRSELRSVLVEGGVVFPDDELQLIIGSVVDARGRESLTPEESEVKARVLRRAAGEPLAYVVGHVEFRGLTLEIGPGVFIPRPGTSAVVDRAVSALPRGGVLADLCTGCGAIALTVAFERPDATVLAADVSATALSWAERNRASLGLGVKLLEGDLFAPFPKARLGAIDVVAANPPHVPSEGEHFMPRDVVDREPPVALFSGPRGFTLIGRIVEESAQWLRPGGWLTCEAGDSQMDEVIGLMQASDYLNVASYPDESGRLRVVEGRRVPR